MVGSTPTRFRHISLICRKLQKNEAAKGGIKGYASGFCKQFSAARVTPDPKMPESPVIQNLNRTVFKAITSAEMRFRRAAFRCIAFHSLGKVWIPIARSNQIKQLQTTYAAMAAPFGSN
jgi:hypothetical protein